MWHGFEGIGWGWMGLGMVHMVLFWIVWIVLLVALVRWLAGSGSGGGPDPMQILKARYAKGELSREEFERMKRELRE